MVEKFQPHWTGWQAATPVLDTSNVTMRCALDVLDREMDRCAPMRFVRHREIEAARHRNDIKAIVPKGVTARLLNCHEYRGGPLVV